MNQSQPCIYENGWVYIKKRLLRKVEKISPTTVFCEGKIAPRGMQSNTQPVQTPYIHDTSRTTRREFVLNECMKQLPSVLCGFDGMPYLCGERKTRE